VLAYEELSFSAINVLCYFSQQHISQMLYIETNRYQGFFPRGLKQLGHADNLHIVLCLRMHGAVLPLPQYVFMVWYLKHRDDLPLPLTYLYIE
jgi:hypothetical protein